MHAYGWREDEPDEKRRYLAVLTATDDGIGRIVQTLNEAGLSENTLLIVLSDNGAFMMPSRGLEVASNLPLRDGGVTLWEGGIRVPCLIRWPGKLPAGTVCDEPLVSMDLLPLILSAAGVALPTDRIIDGRDPLEALSGRGKSPHDFLAFRWSEMSSLREGPYKIVRHSDNAPWQLYHLAADLSETQDRAEQQPEIVQRLSARFIRWDEETQNEN